MPKKNENNSNNWVWGKILGYSIGTRVKLVLNHPILKEHLNMLREPSSFFNFDIIDKGTIGTITKVIQLANMRLYMVNFPNNPDTLVTEEEIEPDEK